MWLKRGRSTQLENPLVGCYLGQPNRQHSLVTWYQRSLHCVLSPGTVRESITQNTPPPSPEWYYNFRVYLTTYTYKLNTILLSVCVAVMFMSCFIVFAVDFLKWLSHSVLLQDRRNSHAWTTTSPNLMGLFFSINNYTKGWSLRQLSTVVY